MLRNARRWVCLWVLCLACDGEARLERHGPHDAAPPASPDASSDASDASDPPDAGKPVADAGMVDAGHGTETLARASAKRLSADEIVRVHEAQRVLPGDVRLANRYVQFVITGGTGSDGYTAHPGVLVDAQLQGEPRERSYDGLDEFVPQVNGCLVNASELSIVSDGSDGGAAEVMVTGPDLMIPQVLNMFGYEPVARGLAIAVHYSLGANDRALTIRTVVRNPRAESVPAAVGDLVLFGADEAHMFTLPGGFALKSQLKQLQLLGAAHDTLRWTAGVFSADADLTLIKDVTLAQMLANKGDSLTQYTLRERMLGPGEQLEVTRYLALGADVAAVTSEVARIRGTRLAELRGHVQSAGAPLAGARISLFEQQDAARFVTQALSDDAGEFVAGVPAGDYRVVVTGRGNGEHVPVKGRPRLLAEGHPPFVQPSLHVPTKGATFTAELPASARVTLRVRDDHGAPVVAKLTLRAEQTPVPLQLAAGETAPYPARNTYDLFWALAGDVDAEVVPGTYTVTASHGPGYALDVKSGVQLAAGDNGTLDFVIARQVPALGYVSVDSHLHGMDSQHGSVTRRERVITATSEGLDVQVATDHFTISDYTPIVSELGLAAQALPVPSIELTTPASGHHNIWPLRPQPDLPNRGACAAWSGDPLGSYYDYYAKLGGIVFGVNHGADYFGPAGFDLATATVRADADFTFRFNAMEVQNGKSSTSRAALVPIWYSLLNHGQRVAPLGASDSHWRVPEPGVARTFVLAAPPSGLPSAQQVAEAVTELRSVASTGPLIAFASSDGQSRLGDERSVRAGASLGFHIAVWAPEWMTLSQVRLIEGGAIKQTWDASSTPAVQLEQTSEGVRWFEHHVDVQPAGDTWYAVEVTGDVDLVPVFPGVKPWAHTAPIFVKVTP